MYSEETEVDLQLRHRHSSENSSASHEGSQSVHSSRSGKDLFTSSFIRNPAEDRSKYEKLLNDDFEMKSPLDINESAEKVPYRVTMDTSAPCNVEFHANNDDSDSIGSASDLRERVDSSGEDDGSSAASDDGGKASDMPNMSLDQNASSSNICSEKLNKKSPGLKDALQDVFSGHIESGRPLLDEESSDDDQNEALLPGNVKGSNSSSAVVSPITAVTPPASPGEKSRSLDVFGAAPFKRLSKFANPAKDPLLSPDKNNEDDVFAQAPFKIPPFKGQKDSFKNSLKKKKDSDIDTKIVSQSSETFSAVQGTFLPDVVPGVELSARKNSVKYTAQESKIVAAPIPHASSTDLFGSAPFDKISEKDLNKTQNISPNTIQPPSVPTQVSNVVITYQKQILANQPTVSPAPIPPPSASGSITRRKSNQDLFGAVPFSAVAPTLATQKKPPPPVAPKPKTITRAHTIGDPLPSSSMTKHVTDNGNISRESSGSFSSESCDESKLTASLTASVDKSKYKELIDEDSLAHDENVNVLKSGHGHYTQLKPIKKSKHFKKKEAKDKMSSSNAFSNMSFEDIVSDDESQYTQSFLRESSSIRRTSNSFRIAKIN